MADFVQTGPFSRKAAEKVERLPGQLLQALGLGKLGETTKYLSSVKASQDFTNLLRGQLPSVGRPAAAEPAMQGPTRDIYEVPGTGYFDRRSGRFLGQAPSAPQLPSSGTTPIVLGTRDGVTPDRTQSDEYKAQLAQYGALQKAKKFEEADKLGMEIWQHKYGKTPMAQPGGAVGAFNPLMQSTFGYQKGENQVAPQYAGKEIQPLGSADFAIAANAVPAPWNEQGAKVSAEFAGVVPFQAAKTTGTGMPAFQTTGEKAAEFLKDPQVARFFQK